MDKLTKKSSRDSILNASLIGVEFEFYSNKSLEETHREIESLLGLPISLEDKAHSDFQPTADHFKIEPDMSGGSGLIELVTGALPYRNARITIIKVLGWIRENGYTTDRASIHLNISFNSKHLENPAMVSKMNTLKFILSFNEKQVFKFFPEREDSVYCKSIKWVMPKSESVNFEANQINTLNFEFPNTKYYGVNFLKKEKNYIEFRYIGGKDYEKRQEDILYLAERFTLQLFYACMDKDFTPADKIEFKRILAKNKPIIKALKDHRNLNKYWPNINILVDLQDNYQVVKVHWDSIKKRILDLIVKGSLTEGIINYDSDFGSVQVKDGKMDTCFWAENYEFISSKLRGTFINCDFYGCEIESSDIETSNFYQATEAKESKIKSSFIHGSCEIINSYIFGKDTIFKGKMVGGIFREGNVGPFARFEDTETVSSKKINS
jgi:hypothetical protein